MRVRIAMLLLGVLALGAAPAWGEAMGAVVRVGEGDEEIWSRIRGQASDLDVTLIRAANAGAAGDAGGAGEAGGAALADQLDVAGQLARAHQARVVVWFRPLPRGRGIVIYVAEPAADTVFVRRMPQQDASPAARSAMAEAAALVVRSALRALAAGGRIGVATREAVEQAPRAPARLAEPARAAARVPAQPMLGLLGTGWQVVGDGHARAGHHGIAAWLGARRGRWQAALTLAAHPAVTSTDALTTIHVTRYSAALGLGYGWRVAGRTELVADLGAGAILHTRSTTSLSPLVMPTAPANLVSFFLSPGARVRIPLHGRGTGIFLELSVAGDVLLGAPAFGYQTRDGFVTRDRLWPVQPRVGLGILLQAR